MAAGATRLLAVIWLIYLVCCRSWFIISASPIGFCWGLPPNCPTKFPFSFGWSFWGSWNLCWLVSLMIISLNLPWSFLRAWRISGSSWLLLCYGCGLAKRVIISFKCGSSEDGWNGCGNGLSLPPLNWGDSRRGFYCCCRFCITVIPWFRCCCSLGGDSVRAPNVSFLDVGAFH